MDRDRSAAGGQPRVRLAGDLRQRAVRRIEVGRGLLVPADGAVDRGPSRDLGRHAALHPSPASSPTPTKGVDPAKVLQECLRLRRAARHPEPPAEKAHRVARRRRATAPKPQRSRPFLRTTSGGPAVYVSEFVQTHARIHLEGAEIRAELWEHPKPAPRRLRTVEPFGCRRRPGSRRSGPRRHPASRSRKGRARPASRRSRSPRLPRRATGSDPPAPTSTRGKPRALPAHDRQRRLRHPQRAEKVRLHLSPDVVPAVAARDGCILRAPSIPEI